MSVVTRVQRNSITAHTVIRQGMRTKLPVATDSYIRNKHNFHLPRLYVLYFTILSAMGGADASVFVLLKIYFIAQRVTH